MMGGADDFFENGRLINGIIGIGSQSVRRDRDIEGRLGVIERKVRTKRMG